MHKLASPPHVGPCKTSQGKLWEDVEKSLEASTATLPLLLSWAYVLVCSSLAAFLQIESKQLHKCCLPPLEIGERVDGTIQSIQLDRASMMRGLH
jgi:hypothetical protein